MFQVSNIKGSCRIEIHLVKMTRQKQQKLLIETSKKDFEEVYNTIQLATTIDSSSEVIFEGWLSKQGTLNWNERYFILRPWMLYYYTKKDNDVMIDDYDIQLLEDEEEMINELKKDSITEAAHGIIPIYPNTIIQHSMEPKSRKSSFFTFPNSPTVRENSSVGKRTRSNSGKDTLLIYNTVQSEKILTPLSSGQNTPVSNSPPTTPIKKRASVIVEDSGTQYMKIATKDSSGSSKIYYFKHYNSDILDSWIKILQTSVIKHRVRRKRELIIGNLNPYLILKLNLRK